VASHFCAAAILTAAEGEQIISFRAMPNDQCSGKRGVCDSQGLDGNALGQCTARWNGVIVVLTALIIGKNISLVAVVNRLPVGPGNTDRRRTPPISSTHWIWQISEGD
jgi:hypothetical protein